MRKHDLIFGKQQKFNYNFNNRKNDCKQIIEYFYEQVHIQS